MSNDAKRGDKGWNLCRHNCRCEVIELHESGMFVRVRNRGRARKEQWIGKDQFRPWEPKRGSSH